MALNGFLVGTKGDTAEVLTNSGRIVRVPAERAKGLPPVSTSAVRQEAKARKGTPRQLLAYDYLTHVKGWKPHQAAAIVGRLSQESGKNLDPAAVGDSGTAFGIAQWRGDRNKRRLQFHHENGNNPKDLFAELDYFDYEIRNHETRAYETISAARTVDEAAAGMMMYERPQGFTYDDPSAGHGWDNTLEYSTDILEDVGLDPSSNFDVIFGSEPMELPEDSEEPVADPGPTRLGDVVDFGALGGGENPATMNDVYSRLAGQRQETQGLIDAGVEAQMNWAKPV